MWNGLGVNYKAKQSEWASDASYFQSIGMKNLRIHIPSTPTPWSEAQNKVWRDCANYFVNAGFWVTTGVSAPNGTVSGNLTATRYAEYALSVIEEAKYLQANNIKLGAFCIGNELEGVVDGTTLTIPQVITNLRQLATDVKAVYTLSPITYSCYDRFLTTYDQWITQGLGGLDLLGIQPYGNIHSSTNSNSVRLGGYAVIQKMIVAFGADKCYISEFNLEANDTNLQKIPDEIRVVEMRKKYAFIKSLGFTKALVYSWVGYNNANNQFAMKNMDGSFNSMWDVLLTDNGRRTFINK
mgnify:CR=1 FL=1